MPESKLEARLDMSRPVIMNDDGTISIPVIWSEDGVEHEDYARVDGQTLLQMKAVHKFQQTHKSPERTS